MCVGSSILKYDGKCVDGKCQYSLKNCEFGCVNGSCYEIDYKCEEDVCPPFVVYTIFFDDIDKVQKLIHGMVYYEINDSELGKHLYFHIANGEENVENLTIYTECSGLLKRNETSGNYDNPVRYFIYKRSEPIFSERKAQEMDYYGRVIENVTVFGLDYFRDNDGVLLNDYNSRVLLMNPGGSVNYRMWFHYSGFIPKNNETGEFIEGDYRLGCQFDIVSKKPYYVVNKDIVIAFQVS